MLSMAVAAAADLTGTWRVDVHLVHDVRVPVLGHSRSDAWTVQLWEVADGRMQNRHCSIRAVTRNPVAKPRMPDAFVAAIPPTVADVELEGDRFRVDLGTGRIGYAGDEVPIEPDDPSLVDHEGDGHPGATIAVWAPIFGEVEVYVAQRTHILLEGTLDGEGVAGAAKQVELVQHTLGAGNRLFAQQPSVTPVVEEGTFTMTRVPAGTTCADPAMAPEKSGQ
ncbi:MAG: hypothetical protein H6737_16245 [Alphaproteobacteria bacterium]|nr:hypothetical protein [Alphaproteobacteria bacterium]